MLSPGSEVQSSCRANVCSRAIRTGAGAPARPSKEVTLRLELIARLVILALAGLSSPARADWRPATEQENAFHERVLRTIAQAMPAAPAGWQLVSQTPLDPLDRVYAGSEKEPFRVEYVIAWRNPNARGLDGQDVARIAEMARRETGSAQVTTLQAERQKLAEAVGRAAGAGDTAAMSRLIAQLDAVDARLEPLLAAATAKIDKEVEAHEAHDVSLRITVRVNAPGEAYEDTPAGNPVAGLKVYRQPGGHVAGSGWREEVDRVFLGRNISLVPRNGLLLLRLPRASRSLSAHFIEVIVEADAERAREALENIGWAAIKALLE